MEQMLKPFSLLAPEISENYAELTENTVNDLSLDFLIQHLSDSEADRQSLKTILLKLPKDSRIIQYRQEIYQDLKNYPELCETFREIFDSVRFGSLDTTHIQYSKASIWELMDRLRSLEQYCQAVSEIQILLQDKTFKSRGMKQFSDFIHKIYDNSGFSELSQDIKFLSDDVMSIRSMTLGVNFNSEFAPSEIGIVSLNTYEYTEKGFLEKFIRFHRKRHPEDKTLTPFTMLSHAGNGTASESLLMKNLTSLIEEMLPAMTARLRKILKRYTDLSGTALAGLGDELLFYLCFIRLEQKIRKLGLPCSMPVFSDQESHLADFYNIRLALCKLDGTVENPIICNPLDFTQAQTILILTGPNQGGKTIFTQGIGLAFLMAQHGVFTPCSSGTIRICDGIYTHFPADENRTVSFGRLGEEALRFREICRMATKDSILLFNESFATTSHTESLYIAENSLKYLCCLGARTCFNTHMHELAQNPDSLRTEHAVCGAVSLVMGKRGSAEAYQVRCTAPDGLSYAYEIARQYGITFEQLCEELS
ncbi:MAG: hypothetical protein IJ642_02870 [Oscillospiraceae bacterium]|nr:hypothetical protein [Oscillospiraceae bacterium]